ncbi:hypothetical protein [Streptomyces olivochromogenes]|uniref:hypothetical protein n=1 Tax=Streptomyces olivochromogenes TaxID=1963 RepID=UPI00099EAB46|nr:hypothetical protein [Streptomyces olivochromogenes]
MASTSVPRSGPGDAVGYRPVMWIMTGLVGPCWLILVISPMRRERDLPQTYEPEQAHARR